LADLHATNTISFSCTIDSNWLLETLFQPCAAIEVTKQRRQRGVIWRSITILLSKKSFKIESTKILQERV
jgi:hypothetical protein